MVEFAVRPVNGIDREPLEAKRWRVGMRHKYQQTREVTMKNSLAIILLTISLSGCTTLTASDGGNRPLLGFAELATEITVRYEEARTLPGDEHTASVAMRVTDR